MIEVEIKAHIADTAAVGKRLHPLADYLGVIDRRDSYYTLLTPYGERAFRIRNQGTQVLCTTKERTVVENVEVNREMEFQITDPTSFRRFMKSMGAHLLIQKRKVGHSWRWGRYTVEVVEVEGLGGFIEIECLVAPPDYTPAQHTHIVKEFYTLLDLLEIAPSQVEPQRYIDMLRMRRHPHTDTDTDTHTDIDTHTDTPKDTPNESTPHRGS